MLNPFVHWTMPDQTLVSVGQLCGAHHTRAMADRLAWRTTQRQRVITILRDKTLTDADARASALAEIEDNPY